MVSVSRSLHAGGAEAAASLSEDAGLAVPWLLKEADVSEYSSNLDSSTTD